MKAHAAPAVSCYGDVEIHYQREQALFASRTRSRQGMQVLEEMSPVRTTASHGYILDVAQRAEVRAAEAAGILC
jgi:hypothetical protein